jgi:hypothetical protein
VTEIGSSANPPVAPARGGCLTALLVVMLILNGLVVVLYSFCLLSGRVLLPTAPRWGLPALLLFGLVNVASVVALWRWQRWGLYALTASALVIFGVNLSLGLPIVACVLGLLGPVLAFILVRPVWHQFT